MGAGAGSRERTASTAAEGAVEFGTRSQPRLQPPSRRLCSGGPPGEPSAWSSGSTTTGPARTCTSGRRTRLHLRQRVPGGRGPARPVLWRGYDWVHIRAEWSASRNEIGSWSTARRWVRRALTAPSRPPPEFVDSYLGGCYPSLYTCPQPGGGGHADGTINEFYIYAGAGSSAAGNPDSIGYAGLTGALDSSGWALDALADPSTNRTLGLNATDATSRRGNYLMFGSDSKFRGMNISLAQAGQGSAELAVAVLGRHGLGPHGRTSGKQRQLRVHRYDERSQEERQPLVVRSMTGMASAGGPRHGSPTRSTGGRTSTTFGRSSRTTSEATARDRWRARSGRTSLWCSTAANVNTIDELQHPGPCDHGGEARGLPRGGFDVCGVGRVGDGFGTGQPRLPPLPRADENGPWERLTQSLIPGLGSSPEGKRYSFLDSGLRNGATYSTGSRT